MRADLTRLFRHASHGAALALLLAACKPVTYHGTAYDPPEPAPPLALSRADGSPFSLAAQRGSVVLLYFGYTHCPDLCPTTLADWHRARAALGRDAERTRWVFVSVDPARDDPVTLQRYVSGFDPALRRDHRRFLTHRRHRICLSRHFREGKQRLCQRLRRRSFIAHFRDWQGREAAAPLQRWHTPVGHRRRRPRATEELMLRRIIARTVAPDARV